MSISSSDAANDSFPATPADVQGVMPATTMRPATDASTQDYRGALKTTILWLGGLLGIGLFTWCGVFFYWQWQIRSAIREWGNSQAPDAPWVQEDERLFVVLHRAGCRALPCLVHDLNASHDRRFDEALLSMITCRLAAGGPGLHASWETEDWDARWGHDPHPESPDPTTRKERFNLWWASHGHEYHQSWRVWESWCHGD
jgi:hypothetical protein